MSADRIGPKAGWHRGRSLRPSPDGGFVVPAGRPMSITDRSSGIASLELAADALTPVAAALRLGSRCAFLLESVEEGVRYGRYSFVGVHGRTLVADRDGARLLSPDGDRLLAETEPLEALQSVLPDEPDRSPELPFPLASGVGYLAYEAAARWEPIPVPEADPVGLPLAVFHLPAAVIVFDHLAQVATLAALDADGAGRLLRDVADAITRPVLDEAPLGVGAAVAPAEADPAGRARFEAGVARLVEEIRAGEMLQAVLARRFSVPTRRSPMTIHRSLRRVNPSPHLFYVDLECVAPRAALVGASPELLVRGRGSWLTQFPSARRRKSRRRRPRCWRRSAPIPLRQRQPETTDEPAARLRSRQLRLVHVQPRAAPGAAGWQDRCRAQRPDQRRGGRRATAGRHGHLAWSLAPGGRRHQRGPRPPAGLANPDAGGVPRPPGHRRRIRRVGRTCRAGPRQADAGGPRRPWLVRGPPLAARRRPLPLPGHRRGHAPA